MNDMKILMVCLGNICRSPLAEGILRNKILLKATEIFKSQFELADSKKKENRLLKNMKDLLLSKLATIEN